MYYLIENTSFVRIATATSFIHAVIFNVLVLYYLIAYSNLFSEKTVLGKLVHEYLDMLSFNSDMIVWLVIVWIILFIGYELLPPIGEAALIYYLDDDQQNGARAFAKWMYKFFPMFEFDASTMFFKSSFILLVIIRLILFGLIDNVLIMILMTIWIVIWFFVNLLLPYSKLIICLEGEGFFDAMKKSVSMSINNIGVTAKFVVINFILTIRFLVNMAIIIGIPIGLIYLGAQFWLQDIAFLNTLFLIILIGLVFVAAYIEGIIEAFFTAAWWKIYKSVQEGTITE